jgi:broad specificity phosphatase PhoE
MSLRLTLICHAATSATRAASFATDEPLEPLGLAKALAMAGQLRRVDTAWSSPALRAVQTAAALGLSATVDPRLRDIDLGRWAGRALTDIATTDPVGLAAWTADAAAQPHGGEAITDVLERVAAWLETLESREGRLVAVTHAAIIRAAIIVALDAKALSFWRIDVIPLCFASFRGRAGHWTLSSLSVSPVADRLPSSL